MEVGDAYTYLAYRRKSQFFIGFVVGKWNDETCDAFYEMLSGRLRFPTGKRRVTIFSDGNKQNIEGIRKHFPQGSVNFGMRKKIRAGQKITGVVSKVISGYIPKDLVAINQIDGFCSKLRERISCYTRKARSFAKKKQSIQERLEIFGIQHNFMEARNNLTPAMKEGLESKPLTWNTFFHRRLSYLN